MRIAYLSCDFGVPAGGHAGSSVHLRETVLALRRLGHDVLLVSPEAEPHEGLAAPLEGMAAEAVRLLGDEALPPRLDRDVRKLLYAEQVQRRALSALEEFRPRVVYERHSLLGYAGMELAHLLDVPFVLEVNAPLALEQAAHRGLVLRRTATALEASILRAADALVVVSRALRDHARRLGVTEDRITVLPNGADPDRFHPAVDGRAVRERYGLGLDTSVVGFVGSLKPWHDLDTLVRAGVLLRRHGHDVRLLAVGEGPRAAELERGEAWVVSTGAVEHDQVPAYLAAMDVVVVPYAGDAAYFSPLKLFEAMAMARPAIAARTGQAQEVIEDGLTGLLYDPGDAAELAVRIEDLLVAPARAAVLGSAARRVVLARHTWAHNARRIDALLGALVGRGVVAA